MLQLARQGRLKIVYNDTLWVQIPSPRPNCCSADNPVDGFHASRATTAKRFTLRLCMRTTTDEGSTLYHLSWCYGKIEKIEVCYKSSWYRPVTRSRVVSATLPALYSSSTMRRRSGIIVIKNSDNVNCGDSSRTSPWQGGLVLPAFCLTFNVIFNIIYLERSRTQMRISGWILGSITNRKETNLQEIMRPHNWDFLINQKLNCLHYSYKILILFISVD